MSECCEVCRYSGIDINGYFICRRYAPKPSEKVKLHNYFPVVKRNDWCGEFQGTFVSDVNKAAEVYSQEVK